MTPSGFTFSCSHARNLPVRPMPVWISSQIRSTLRSRQMRAHSREIPRRRHDDAAFALDRLDQERGGVGADRTRERVGIAVRDVAKAAGNGPKPSRYCGSVEKPTIVIERPWKLPLHTMISARSAGMPLTL